MIGIILAQNYGDCSGKVPAAGFELRDLLKCPFTASATAMIKAEIGDAKPITLIGQFNLFWGTAAAV